MLHVSQVCSKGKSLLRGGACVCVWGGGGGGGGGGGTQM